MAELQRFNQGFLKFGPMEQCSDGEWVRYEDVQKLIEYQMQRMEDIKDTADAIARQRDQLIEDNRDLADLYHDKRSLARSLDEDRRNWRAASGAFVIIFVVVQVLQVAVMHGWL